MIRRDPVLMNVELNQLLPLVATLWRCCFLACLQWDVFSISFRMGVHRGSFHSRIM